MGILLNDMDTVLNDVGVLQNVLVVSLYDVGIVLNEVVVTLDEAANLLNKLSVMSDEATEYSCFGMGFFCCILLIYSFFRKKSFCYLFQFTYFSNSYGSTSKYLLKILMVVSVMSFFPDSQREIFIPVVFSKSNCESPFSFLFFLILQAT